MLYIGCLIIVLASCRADVSEDEIHRFLKEDGFNHIFGGKFREYEITSPILNGRITRSLTKHPEEVNYAINAFGKQIELNLKKASEARHVKFSTRHEDGSTTENIVKVADCYYHGDVGSGDGWVAVSLCDGMSGIIHTSDDIYVIQALPEHMRKTRSADSKGEVEHVIYRKRELDGHFCGTSERLFAQVNDTVKRQANAAGAKQLTVETAIFLDNAMQDYFSKIYSRNFEANVLQYALSSLNAIQRLYNHQTMIGKPIIFACIKVEIWRRNPHDLHVVDDASQYLNNFCQWQDRKNVGDDSHADHWDHTFLFTGLDIQVNGNAGVVGIAPVSGMCDPTRSCTVTEATYFEGVSTGAHECGHNFGMMHDSEGNTCDKTKYIMAAMVGEGQTSWSSCSRDYMNSYLRHPRTVCLLDQRKSKNNYDHEAHELPGQIYDIDLQCEFKMGEGATKNKQSRLVDMCDSVKCEKGNYMTTIHPALEGTYCGPSSWCRGGRCVRWSAPGPRIVDGGWGPFGTQSNCEVTCLKGSTGISKTNRQCNNPRPKNGGRECQGDAERITLCDDAFDCPSLNKRWDNVEFARRVCERAPAHLRGQITGEGAQFLDDDKNACVVWCKKLVGGFFSFGEIFPDGASCSNTNRNKFCINGMCTQAV